MRHAITILLLIVVGLLMHEVSGNRRDIRDLQDRIFWLEDWQAKEDKQLQIFPPKEKSA